MDVTEDIRVEIGELVLVGFSQVKTDLLVRAFETELTRLLRASGITSRGLELDLVSGLPPLPRTTSARRLGEALAWSVHKGLSRGTP
jgi:hypothetical protein